MNYRNWGDFFFHSIWHRNRSEFKLSLLFFINFNSTLSRFSSIYCIFHLRLAAYRRCSGELFNCSDSELFSDSRGSGTFIGIGHRFAALESPSVEWRESQFRFLTWLPFSIRSRIITPSGWSPRVEDSPIFSKSVPLSILSARLGNKQIK